MVATQASKVLHCLRTLALHQHDGATDGDLLDLYIRQKDEAAFEALVQRHSRMVLGVCRRILGNSHDAEDAFQATFLVLVRKAASIRPAGMVGNWLYGVAQRTALEARRSAAKRRAKETQVAPRTETPDDTLTHLRPLLDQELSRLPDKYRAVLVLCDLEGRTRKEAALQLGLPEGTIASRQATARTILAKRLTRHKVTLSGAALAAVLTEDAASASAPLSLVLATVRAASAYAAGPATAVAVVSVPVAALTEGVLRTMLLSKLKITALLLVVIGLGGTGWGNYRTLASDQPAVQREQQVAQADFAQSEKPDADNRILSCDDLRGKWTGGKNGIKVDLTFNGEKVYWQVEFNKTRRPQPPQPPTVGVNMGAGLRCVADVKAGCLNLYLPKYLGDNKERKENPSYNGARPVGRIQRGAEGTLQLRIIPTGLENLDQEDFDYPAVDGLILRRVTEPSKEGKKTPDGNKPAQDQAKQVLDMILQGFQAYQDAKGGREQATAIVRVPDVYTTTVGLTANGTMLATGGSDQTVRVWDVASGKTLHTLKGHTVAINCLKFSPDGKTLASATGDWVRDTDPGEVKLWDVATGKERASLKGHAVIVISLAFSPDGKTLASASDTVKVWDVATGKEKVEIPGFGNSVAFSKNGTTLAVGRGVREDNTPGWVELWDTTTWKERAKLPGHVGMVPCVVFSPDSKILASADSKGTLKLWDVGTEKERVSINNEDCSFLLAPLAFTADGKKLVSTMRCNTGQGDGALIARTWDVASGKKQVTYLLPPEREDFLTAFTALSADGKRLATGGFERLDKGKRPQSEWKINGVMTVWEVKSLPVLPAKKPAGAESGEKGQ